MRTHVDPYGPGAIGRAVLTSGRFVAGLLCLCVLLLTSFVAGASAAGGELVQAHGYKMAGDASRMRVVIRFDREPEVRWSLLRGPHRLMLDLPNASVDFDHGELSARGMVTDVQYGGLEDNKSRVIISFDGPFQVERVDILENDEGDGSRLVADIVATSEAAFEKAMVEQIEVTASTQTTPKVDRIARVSGDRPVRIVIDPGHGGIDTGAEGPNGTLEKTITLAFSLELKKKLQDTGLYDVFMTRDRDDFLRLDERVKIARQHEADLLISVHADSIRLKNVRGATVYTVSDKASDAEAAAKAIRENLADAIGGIVVEEEDQGVADILADLIRRETQTFSIRFARSLVGELSSAIQMIPTNPHRFAGFRVLKAPDVPSVLLELGYLSNAQDEEQLRDPVWREKAADSIISAINRFATHAHGAGG